MHKMEYRHTKTWPYHISAGGAIHRVNEAGETEVMVLYRNLDDGRHYHLPKGTLHYNETLESCALREVREESGVTAKIEGYIGAFTDDFVHKGVYINKTTHYFAMRPISQVAEHDHEHDGAEWIEIEQTKELLKSTEPEKKEYIVLDRLQDFIKP